MKCSRMNTYENGRGATAANVVFAANVYQLPQKGHQQDALFAGDKVELRGGKEVIRSFAA